MKTLLKKFVVIFAFAFAMLVLTYSKNVDAKVTKNYKYTVIQNSYYTRLEDASDKNRMGKVKKIIVSNKKKLSVVENPYTYCNDYEEGLYVVGKKPGKVKVTVKTKKTDYVYKIKILSSKKLNKKAKKALKKVAKGLNKTKKCAYVDLTGDSIKDLYVNGDIYSYDRKAGVQKTTIGGYGRWYKKEIKKIHISYDNQVIYLDLNNEKKEDISEYDEYDKDDMYSMTCTGFVYSMRDIRNSFNPNDESEELEEERYLGIIDYPRYFVPKKKFKLQHYYIINYPHNDQDDAWYNYFTEKEYQSAKKRILKNKKTVKLTKKPVFK